MTAKIEGHAPRLPGAGGTGGGAIVRVDTYLADVGSFSVEVTMAEADCSLLLFVWDRLVLPGLLWPESVGVDGFAAGSPYIEVFTAGNQGGVTYTALISEVDGTPLQAGVTYTLQKDDFGIGGSPPDNSAVACIAMQVRNSALAVQGTTGS